MKMLHECVHQKNYIQNIIYILHIQIFGTIAILFYLSTTTYTYQTIMDSPIQIIAIQSPTGARLLRPSTLRDARNNRNNNNIDKANGSSSTIRIIGNKEKNVQTAGRDAGRKSETGGFHNNNNNQNNNANNNKNNINRAGRGSKIIVIHPEQNRRPHMMVNSHRAMRLHVAPGAYPVYYGIARANGLFDGQQIRSFSTRQKHTKSKTMMVKT